MEQLQLWGLKTGDIFAVPGKLSTYEYLGNGWYSRPYSGGPWHNEYSGDFPVERLPPLTLRELVTPETVHTCKALHDRLLNAARLLWTLGHRSRAVLWYDRLQQLPVHVGGEAIRTVLKIAWHELEHHKVDMDQAATFEWLIDSDVR